MKPSPESLDEPLRTLADRAPVPLWAARWDKSCMYVNPCWLAFTGRSLEQELYEGWVNFCQEHEAPSEAIGIGTNYRDVCRWAVQGGAGLLPLALQGVESVLNGRRERFTLEYPAPSAGTPRWFDLVVYPLRSPVRGAILAQLEVTQRHWAEALARKLARADASQAQAALCQVIAGAK